MDQAQTKTGNIPDGDETIIVLGAGIAGVRVALTLRECGFEGRIKLLSAEVHSPYDRPPLSKAVLASVDGESRISLDPKGELSAGAVELKCGAACTAIDRAAKAIRLKNGDVLAYDRLVIATGSSVRTLDGLPPQRPGVHYLRTLDDALRLRRAVQRRCRVAVAGAGVIGLEVAASLVSMGHQVSVIDPASRVMARSASPILGEFLRQRHEAAGVDLRLGNAIETVDEDKEAFRLVLRDGSRLVVDQIIVGVGVLPNSGLAAACGLEVVPQGIVVDGRGQTSDPAIYAAGEVAYHHNALLGCHDRQETWAHAAAHGEHVARSIMGREDGYAERASYWTDQYDLNIQVIGAPSGEQDIVRGDLSSSSGIIFHLVSGRVAGVTAVNAVRDFRAAKKLLDMPIARPEDLADTTTDLKAIM